jgi:hypothetical protein
MVRTVASYSLDVPSKHNIIARDFRCALSGKGPEAGMEEEGTVAMGGEGSTEQGDMRPTQSFK